MQNWEHVLHIFKHLNRIPKESHGCDFSRVKSYFLDGHAQYLRQTIVLAESLTPEMNSLYNQMFKNVAGKVKIARAHMGTIHETLVQVPQYFKRFDAVSASDEPDARFRFFTEKIFPTIQKSALQQSHTLIFIPSYFDFVRIRNFFKESELSFEKLCEYTESKNISRARGEFFKGNVSFLLYTERFHFFRRYTIRGVKHVVFYGLPENQQFYSEMLNNLQNAEESTCMALFSKYDRLRLERIVGTKRVERMCSGQKDAFMFS
jgi:U3 small nucleolar RNA-associated protein 25